MFHACPSGSQQRQKISTCTGEQHVFHNAASIFLALSEALKERCPKGVDQGRAHGPACLLDQKSESFICGEKAAVLLSTRWQRHQYQEGQAKGIPGIQKVQLVTAHHTTLFSTFKNVRGERVLSRCAAASAWPTLGLLKSLVTKASPPSRNSGKGKSWRYVGRVLGLQSHALCTIRSA